MIFLVNKYYLVENHIVVFRNVTLITKPGTNTHTSLLDQDSGETIFADKNWKEYVPAIGDVFVPFHKTADTPIRIGFREFSKPFEIYHTNCELIYNHDHHNYVIVRCQLCGKELMQSINSGECVPLNYIYQGSPEKNIKCTSSLHIE